VSIGHHTSPLELEEEREWMMYENKGGGSDKKEHLRITGNCFCGSDIYINVIENVGYQQGDAHLLRQ